MFNPRVCRCSRGGRVLVGNGVRSACLSHHPTFECLYFFYFCFPVKYKIGKCNIVIETSQIPSQQQQKSINFLPLSDFSLYSTSAPLLRQALVFCTCRFLFGIISFSIVKGNVNTCFGINLYLVIFDTLCEYVINL